MTAQCGEKLILDGEKTSMDFCPPIPDSPEVIVRAEDDFSCSNTACWRGYVGTWKIEDGKFYLTDLKGSIHMAKKEPVFAEWFTGVLRVPQGKLLKYVHMGFGSIYEREIHIKIENGVIVKRRTIDNRERAAKLESMTPKERIKERFRNMPGFENDFEGDDF